MGRATDDNDFYLVAHFFILGIIIGLLLIHMYWQ